MTNSPNVTNFVTDLVAMAKATEELPIIKQALAGETEHANRLAQTVQDRELAILDLKAQLEAAHSKIRQTEAERDDAELRFLELDEKAHQVLGVLDLIAAKASASKVSLEPPKPVEPEPVQSVVDPTTAPTTSSSPSQATGTDASVVASTSTEGQSESHPTPAPASPTPTGTESVSSSSEHHTPVPPAPAYVTNPTSGGEAGSSGQSETPKADTSQDSGQSASPPTLEASLPSWPPSMPSGQVGSEHSSQPEGESASDPSIGTGSSASSTSQPEEVTGPYVGVRYHDMPTYISRPDWLAGGGTERDYDWRP